jgi:hypothetical protein
MISLQSAKTNLASIGVSLKRIDAGFKVDKFDARETDEMYITDDLEDAYFTGLRMGKSGHKL